MLSLLMVAIPLTFASPYTTARFDSAKRIALDGTISQGQIITSSTNTSSIEKEIRAQLKYTIGLLNEISAGPAYTLSLQVSLLSARSLSPSRRLVNYRASLLIGWPRSSAIPENFTLYLPQRTDSSGLTDFFDLYGKPCGDGKAASSFWYYYRQAGCPAKEPGAKFVSPTQLSLSVSELNTEGKSPEYGAIWKDGELNAVVVFGNTGSETDRYAGTQLHDYLSAGFGDATGEVVTLGPDYTSISKQYTSSNGPLRATTFDIKEGSNVQSIGEEFKKAFNSLSEKADFVGYSGHSGMGKNVRAFSLLGSFLKAHYHLYYFHGCDSFSYLDPVLWKRHQAASPEAKASKYLDVIAPVNIGDFTEMVHHNAAVIQALALKYDTYRDILTRIPAGSPAVLGEEDNP